MRTVVAGQYSMQWPSVFIDFEISEPAKARPTLRIRVRGRKLIPLPHLPAHEVILLESDRPLVSIDCGKSFDRDPEFGNLRFISVSRASEGSYGALCRMRRLGDGAVSLVGEFKEHKANRRAICCRFLSDADNACR